jgi:quercetin dioxygenase-like cupin family protein
VYANPHVQVHLLEIKRGGYCSEHRHTRKANLFTVLRGRLEVRVWPDVFQEFDSTILGEGESTVVEVGKWHQFLALDDTVALEVYESAEIGEDIERRNTGGVKE